MKYTARFTDLGEGYMGDYDPTPEAEDVALLRLDTYADGNPLPDGSYCTRVPRDTSQEEQARLLDVVVQVLDQSGGGLKRALERLSWIKPGDTVESFCPKATFIVFHGVATGGYASRRFALPASLIAFARKKCGDLGPEAAQEWTDFENWVASALPGDRTAFYELDWVIALDPSKDTDGLVEYEDA